MTVLPPAELLIALRKPYVRLTDPHPTIAELEAILACDAGAIEILPNGEVRGKSAFVNPQGPQAADTIERLEARVGLFSAKGRRDWITAEQDLLETYIEGYVLSTEGADYEPTEFERELIRDALQGFVVEQDRLLCQHLRKASNLTKDRS